MSSQQEAQEKMVLYQLLQQHMEVLKEQALVLQSKFIEMETTKQAVEDMKEIKEKNETLVPLGSGVYAHGTINDTRKLLVDVGAGVMLNKNIESTLHVIQDRKAEIEEMLQKLHNDLNQIVSKINEIGLEIQAMAQQQQKE